jgi:hypothetical protein
MMEAWGGTPSGEWPASELGLSEVQLWEACAAEQCDYMHHHALRSALATTSAPVLAQLKFNLKPTTTCSRSTHRVLLRRRLLVLHMSRGQH